MACWSRNHKRKDIYQNLKGQY